MASPWRLAIDFGTSFTVAAVAGNGAAEIIEINGERRMPSVVFASESGAILAGRAAEDMATSQPSRAMRAPKRHLGEPSPVVLGGRSYAVVDLVAAVLRPVLAEAVRHQGSEPAEVRLTHPATWTRVRTAALVRAAEVAGISSPVLVPEPVAAAVAYAEQAGVQPGDHVLVYDLGGGTFDTAVLQSTGAGFVVVGRPGGEGRLGGELFDEVVANFAGERLDPAVWERLNTSDDLVWQQAAVRLRNEARRAKETLSVNDVANLMISLPNGMVQQQITRQELDDLLEPYLEESVDLLQQTIDDADLDVGDISSIYLAGGASRLGLVERIVRERFPGVTVSRRGDPKTAVALGAVGGQALPSKERSLGTPAPVVPVPGTVVESAPPTAPVPPTAGTVVEPGPASPSPATVAATVMEPAGPGSLPPPPVAPAPAAATWTPPPPVPAPAGSNKSRTPLIVGAAVAAVVVVVGLLFVLRGGSDDGRATSTSTSTSTSVATTGSTPADTSVKATIGSIGSIGTTAATTATTKASATTATTKASATTATTKAATATTAQAQVTPAALLPLTISKEELNDPAFVETAYIYDNTPICGRSDPPADALAGRAYTRANPATEIESAVFFFRDQSKATTLVNNQREIILTCSGDQVIGGVQANVQFIPVDNFDIAGCQEVVIAGYVVRGAGIEPYAGFLGTLKCGSVVTVLNERFAVTANTDYAGIQAEFNRLFLTVYSKTKPK
jgi:actin-like ATPase involved in cell morphogenesis